MFGEIITIVVAVIIIVVHLCEIVGGKRYFTIQMLQFDWKFVSVSVIVLFVSC